MGFLRRVNGFAHRDKVCRCEIRKALNVEPLSFWIERSQLRLCVRVTRMSQERFVRQVLRTTSSPEVVQRPGGVTYFSDLAWYRLGVEPAELSENAVDHDVFLVLLRVLPPRTSPEKKCVWKWLNVFLQFGPLDTDLKVQNGLGKPKI